MSTNNNNNNNNNNEDIDNDESQQQDNEEQQLQQPQVSTFNEQQCQIREQQEKLTLMTLTTSCYKLKFVLKCKYLIDLLFNKFENELILNKPWQSNFVISIDVFNYENNGLK
ncbi:hypothetical protein ACTFIT_002117 [Dictyostelium discoideum]